MSATDTLITKYFPEDNQRHSLIYEDRTIATINQGIRLLYRVSNTILRYRQSISIQNLFMDRSYEGLIRYNQDQGTLHIRFPSECTGIGNIYNNANCKMITYYRNPDNSYVKEIQITPHTTLDISRNSEIELIVYTQFKKDLIVSFDVYLAKKKHLPIQSSL